MQAYRAFWPRPETHKSTPLRAMDTALDEPYPLGVGAEDADAGGSEAEGVGFWERNHARLLALAVLAVVALSVLALNRILADVNYDDLVVAIQDTSWLNIGLALLFTVLSFAALSIYDRQALALVGHKVPFGYVALTSFCAYAVGNIAGFGPLTGGTVRYRFYSPLGVSPEDVARIVAYVTAAFGFGLRLRGRARPPDGGRKACRAGRPAGNRGARDRYRDPGFRRRGVHRSGGRSAACDRFRAQGRSSRLRERSPCNSSRRCRI